jgi:cell division protein ZapE
LAIDTSSFGSLISQNPKSSISELLADLVPPREFSAARFDNYKPHAEFESQAKAMQKAQNFAAGKTERKLFSKSAPAPAGIYLDGGFGVGKTHLLASIWHGFKGAKAFGSFIAYTSLIGALGFAQAVEALSKFQLICIDEFELDDPGDTMMMSRLLNELEAKGVRFAATSNTPPNALGEGRFAASDFQREIHGISERFEMLRIDGEDYRHRPVDFESRTFTEPQLEEWLAAGNAGQTSVDDFERFLMHLSTIHPSRYGRLLQGFTRVAFKHVYQLNDQVDALRFVAFVDRAYEAQIEMRGTGTSLTEVFSAEYLGGGFRKKYLRAVSRLGAMTE